MLDLSEGEKAVKLARKAITKFLSSKEIIKDEYEGIFSEDRGVFTTLNITNELRGCIGFPYPIQRLDKSIIESAIAAATQDPRFPPVKLEELDDITIEVTVLTPPEKIESERREDLPSMIEVGKHGLIVKFGNNSGLLLPQVAVEYNFDALTFLSQTCYKANLPLNCWMDERVEIFKFEGQIFQEVEPIGEVREVKDKSCD